MDSKFVTDDLLAALSALSADGSADTEELLQIVKKQPLNIAAIGVLANTVLSADFADQRGPFCIALGMVYEALETRSSTRQSIVELRSLAPSVFVLLQGAEQESERFALLYLFAHFPSAVDSAEWGGLEAVEIGQLSLATKPESFSTRTLSFADAERCPQDPQELERLWRKSRDCLWSFLGAQAYWALFSKRLDSDSK